MEKEPSLEFEPLPALMISEDMVKASPEVKEAYWDERLLYVKEGEQIWVQFFFSEQRDVYDYFDGGIRWAQVVRDDDQYFVFRLYGKKGRELASLSPYFSLKSAQSAAQEMVEARHRRDAYASRRDSAAKADLN